MAYEKNELEELALEAIKKHNLYKHSQIVAYLPCSEATFYNHQLEKLESIKEAIFETKIKRKAKLINNWQEVEASASLQIAAFKLMADDDELQRLNNREERQGAENQQIEIIVRDGNLDSISKELTRIQDKKQTDSE